MPKNLNLFTALKKSFDCSSNKKASIMRVTSKLSIIEALLKTVYACPCIVKQLTR